MTLADGTTVHGNAVVLATGVHDELPPIDGLAARWGKSVFNCPFCDGWEHRDQAAVVIDAAPGADHLATLLRSWTPQVTVVAATQVAALIGDSTTLSHVMLRDGSAILTTAAFVKAPVLPRSSIARALGCEVDMDGYIVTSATGATRPPTRMGRRRRTSPATHAASGNTRRSRRLYRGHRHPQSLRCTKHRVRAAQGPPVVVGSSPVELPTPPSGGGPQPPKTLPRRAPLFGQPCKPASARTARLSGLNNAAHETSRRPLRPPSDLP